MVPHPEFNPFSLLMDPESVFRAIEASAGLGGLQARIFRPLDGRGSRLGDAELAAFDASLDEVEHLVDMGLGLAGDGSTV